MSHIYSINTMHFFHKLREKISHFWFDLTLEKVILTKKLGRGYILIRNVFYNTEIYCSFNYLHVKWTCFNENKTFLSWQIKSKQLNASDVHFLCHMLMLLHHSKNLLFNDIIYTDLIDQESTAVAHSSTFVYAIWQVLWLQDVKSDQQPWGFSGRNGYLKFI